MLFAHKMSDPLKNTLQLRGHNPFTQCADSTEMTKYFNSIGRNGLPNMTEIKLWKSKDLA